eukprot:COSAG02_NODE_5760_length_4061_cov_7.851085_1_plen_588_part_00
MAPRLIAPPDARRRKRVTWDPERAVSPVPSVQRLHKRARQLSTATVDAAAADWASSSSGSSSSSSSEDEGEDEEESDTVQEDEVSSSDVDLDDADEEAQATACSAAATPVLVHEAQVLTTRVELSSAVLAGILACCGVRQAAIAARTCRAWAAAFRSPSAWRSLDFDQLFGSQYNRWVCEDLGQVGDSGDSGCSELPSALRSFCAFLLKEEGCRLSQVTKIRIRASQYHRWTSNPSRCEVPSSVLLRLISSAKLIEDLHISGRISTSSVEVGSLLRLRKCSMAVAMQDRSWLRTLGGLGGIRELHLRLRFAGDWDDTTAVLGRLTGQLNCMPQLQQLTLSCIDAAPLASLATVADVFGSNVAAGGVRAERTVGLALSGLVLPALRTLQISASKPCHQLCRLGSCSLPALEDAVLRWSLTNATDVLVMMQQLLKVCMAFGQSQCPALQTLTILIAVDMPEESVAPGLPDALSGSGILGCNVSTLIMNTAASLKAAIACGDAGPPPLALWFDDSAGGSQRFRSDAGARPGVPSTRSHQSDDTVTTSDMRTVQLSITDYLNAGDHPPARGFCRGVPSRMWYCLVFTVSSN